MKWTVSYFIYKSTWWKEATGTNTTKALTAGQKAYAFRQSAQWKFMAAQADRSFALTNFDYVKTF